MIIGGRTQIVTVGEEEKGARDCVYPELYYYSYLKLTLGQIPIKMVTMTSEADKRQSSAIPAINVNATSVILPKKLRSPALGDAPNILVYKKVNIHI